MQSHPYVVTVAEVPGGELRMNEIMLRAYLQDTIDTDEAGIESFIQDLHEKGSMTEDEVTIAYDHPGNYS